jgi:hypothetical protein
MTTFRRTLVVILAVGAVAAPASGASASITLDGSFSAAVTKPSFAGLCPSGAADECATIQLAGLGAADWAYTFGPTFQPDGRCFDVDGAFSITLQSDESTIAGPLTGVFCPRPSETAHRHAGAIAYGNPFTEQDTILFANGTGHFEGLSGTATFDTSAAGARFTGTLSGTLRG